MNKIHNDIIIIKKKLKNAPPLKTGYNINKKVPQKYINIFSKKRSKIFLTEKKQSQSKNLELKSIESIEKEVYKMELFLRMNDKELNELNFKLAVQFDNRSFCRYYFSLSKTEHLLVRIINKKDYNSVIIKIFLFLYNVGLTFTVNGLFFDDEAIEQIFAEGGKFNFLHQIPQIIYSSIISFILFSILDYLALSENLILAIKKMNVTKNIEKKAKNELRTLQVRFIFFFILSFIFMLICWYYISCFCAVYKNTQYYLLKDTLIGFGTSMMSPIATKLLPGIFRVYALRKRSQIFFRMSLFIHMLL